MNSETLMKKLIILIILASIIGCEKENGKQEKFFNPENLGSLDLANINGFWDDDSTIDTSFSGGMIFEKHPGYLEGICIFNREDKHVWISVFTTKDTAIIAMEYRINNVVIMIQDGTVDEIKGTWWFSNDGYNYNVYVNQWNTIIEVWISGTSYNDEEKENILYSTANELAKRVDNLSE